MKKALVFAVVVLVVMRAHAQNLNYAEFKEMGVANMKYLDKSGALDGTRIKFIKEGVRVFDVKGKYFTLPWQGLGGFVELLEVGDYHQLYNSTRVLSDNLSVMGRHGIKLVGDYHPVPTDVHDLVVVLDAGHFAADFDGGVREDKYVKIKGADVGQKKDIAFYEAFLNDVTVAMVHKELETLGARVYLTKGMGQNALAMRYSDWFKRYFRSDLDKAFTDGDISKSYYENLKSADSSAVFNSFFRFVEFRKRIDLINSLNPSLTLSVHYNAMEGGKRDEKGFLKPVKDDYSMAFVPGAFLAGEMNRSSETLDFLRLLFSADMDKSMRLAHLILNDENLAMGVPPVREDQFNLDDKVCTRTTYDGVYCRNLAMTRTVRGPVVYLETLLQDNEHEAVALAKEDYVFEHPNFGKMRVPSRCHQVAMSIVKGIQDWLEENKSYTVALVAK